MKKTFVFSLALVASLALASAASAATTLYATPSPGGGDCGSASPCALQTALSQASDGDTVVVGAGTYAPKLTYEDEGKSLTIAGAVIGAGRPVVTGAFVLEGAGSHIRDLEIDSEDAYALELFDGASADRLLVIAKGGDGCDLTGAGSTITNSVCKSIDDSGYSGLASQGDTDPLTAHNVDMIGYYGFFSNSGNLGEASVTMTNAIAQTTAAADEGEDAAFNQGLTVAINSYFSIFDGGEVEEIEPLTEAPIYRGPGDYREAAGSPTINAGSDSAGAGELDLNGNLRTIDGRTDVGAYEFVPDPPVLSAASASAVSPTTATVTGTVDTRGGFTSYHLEYGTSAAYGSATGDQTKVGSASTTPIAIDLTGLAPGTQLHYSIVATNEAGTTATPGATLNLPAASPLPAPPAALPVLAPTLKLKGKTGGPPRGQPLLDRKAIKLIAGCGPVACKANATAKVKLGGKTLGTLKASKQPTAIAAGAKATISLGVPKALQTRVANSLAADPGERAKVLVTGSFVREDGVSAKRSLTIKVRPLEPRAG